MGYLITVKKSECLGCEACVQICEESAIEMFEDLEGFRYPRINRERCVGCSLCTEICPYDHMPKQYQTDKIAFGGYHKDKQIRNASTSGGAFSAIIETWCKDDYIIFGATAEGVNVYHTYISDKTELEKLRKSKYSQSVIGSAFKDAKTFLKQGKHVVFTGTPCQIAGLKSFIGNINQQRLLTIEVICEGVPSPKFIYKYEQYLERKYGARIEKLDYRYTDSYPLENPILGRWDFEVMYTLLQNGKILKKDRWFNPFWSIWLKHLMSRRSCYCCPFANTKRVADVTLGDLWGVHLYCQDLYGQNGGSSLVICNTDKGKLALQLAQNQMIGHEVDFDTALKYQSPLRKPISENSKRDEFMSDLQCLNYIQLCKKWSSKPSFKLLWSKYVWGNQKKVLMWNIKQKLTNREK